MNRVFTLCFMLSDSLQKHKKKKEKKTKKDKKERKEKRKHRSEYETPKGITTPSKEQLMPSQMDTPMTVKLPVS